MGNLRYKTLTSAAVTYVLLLYMTKETGYNSSVAKAFKVSHVSGVHNTIDMWNFKKVFNTFDMKPLCWLVNEVYNCRFVLFANKHLARKLFCFLFACLAFSLWINKLIANLSNLTRYLQLQSVCDIEMCDYWKTKHTPIDWMQIYTN